jgi:hypothetical protein
MSKPDHGRRLTSRLARKNNKIDIVFQKGHGRPVPVEMDRQIIIYIVGLRKRAVEENQTLIDSVPYDHSDVFYKSRTHLNQHDWDTSVYNDNVAGGSARRKDFYDKIKGVCEKNYGVKRHQIGIFPEDRAVMAFNGRL